MKLRTLVAALAAALIAASAMAASPPDARTTHLASDYAGWASGRDNAQALVTGLHSGSSITLATVRADRSVSLAGFTPDAPMSYAEVARALANARATLARAGIARPDAEQIQAALIGGEVAMPNGGSRLLRGTVAVRGGNPQLAAR